MMVLGVPTYWVGCNCLNEGRKEAALLKSWTKHRFAVRGGAPELCAVINLVGKTIVRPL